MQERPRLLGLDVGNKRIGVAISDRLGLTASGITTIQRKNLKEDLKLIIELVQLHSVEAIIIGMPFNMDGSIGKQAEKTENFGQKLAELTKLPIIYEDERLSSFAATENLVSLGVKTGHKKGLVDRQAAAFILQSYLDKTFNQ